MTAEAEQEPAGPTRGAAPARMLIGLAQGLALYGLHKAWDARSWPATQPAFYWALVLVIALVPLVVLGGLGRIRGRVLAIWTLAAGLITAWLAAHDILRQAPGPLVRTVALEFPTLAAAASALFIAHHLVAAADQERRWIAPYPAYFDVAWKDGVQLVLSALFVGVFWGVLWLGASLFKVIGISVFQDTITKDWFAYPANGVAFAAAVHLTDVRLGLIRGVRTVVLAMLAWLLPLMALIAAAFLVALPFTGLQPLWKTGRSTSILLSAVAVLVLLINAAYQGGDPEWRPPAVLRHAGRLAAVVLTPIVAIAIYGLWLRVHQYGWTESRITASACAVAGACYALGYLVAALKPGGWLKPLEPTNIATAFVILALILALFTSIADPARIAVADQVARLEAGKISPETFDFAYLRFHGGRYGVEALNRLKVQTSGPRAGAIATHAAEALRQTSPWAAEIERPAVQPSLRALITPYPKGRTLPESFLSQKWALGAGPCIGQNVRCDAYFVDLNGDGREEILLGDEHSLWAFQEQADGAWTAVGPLNPMDAKVRDALRSGAAKPVAPAWNDLDVDGQRLRLNPALRPVPAPVAPRNPSAPPAKAH